MTGISTLLFIVSTLLFIVNGALGAVQQVKFWHIPRKLRRNQPKPPQLSAHHVFADLPCKFIG